MLILFTRNSWNVNNNSKGKKNVLHSSDLKVKINKKNL